ncbi:SMI1/KNR4 family protein [Micromonospora sp. H61]|uniref:SMI1/KNR4 family protein n=1 Tax=Micromonospora sp. H61 TaxID=2824888 RepID=UPI001B35F217|nr:SMI1/KNR4 family protein [Micromonospora sp. H61]MBQ0994770.1 SMI1/KNR4 family protein [Micromonospora sp. H61]
MDDRIARIQVKIAALPAAEKAVLGPVLTEQQVSDFEELHGTRMPEEFRQFVTHIGHGGYGPTYGLLSMERWVSGAAGVNGKLAEPFPFVPNVHIAAWSAGRQGSASPTFPGAIAVVYRGCSDFTLLVVTGPGRGRLVEVNAEGFFAPHFHTDPDFLAWYERWLDFTLAGHRNLNLFADQMAGDEAALVATLLNDALATRRRAAACTFITYPAPSASLPDVLTHVLSTEPHPPVRETILRALSAQGEHGRDRLPIALADPVPGVRSLAAILMTTNTPQGRRLSPQLRQTLGNHLTVEEDRSVRDTIQRMLDHSH